MTKIVTALHQGAPSNCGRSIARDLRQGFGDQPVSLLVTFASPKQDLSRLAPELRAAFPEAIVVGATSSGEFTEQGEAKQSTSAFALAGDHVIHAGIGRGLRNGPASAVAEALARLPREVPGCPCCTAIMLLDPLAGRSEEATLHAGEILGPSVRIVGGAAGDDLAMVRTEVSLGDEVASDAIVIVLVFTREPLGFGVAHGHSPLVAPPLRVTRSEGNVVLELEGLPAWHVWTETTRQAARRLGLDVDALHPLEEGAFLLRFEGGLAAGQGNFKVRAPLARRGNAIQFACGIATGSVLHVMESTPERQIESARAAARRAIAGLGGRPPAGALVFDCICRNLILGAAFKEAVAGVAEELRGAPLAGFETYGEIALDAGDMSGFHNTSSVVLVFGK